MPRRNLVSTPERMCLYTTVGIRERLEEEAFQNRRSVTAEMNYIIEQYFAAQDNKKESVTSTLSERS